MADTSSDTARAEEYMLTTVDNPFDPFTQFDQWLSFDTAQGHNTPGLLDQVTITLLASEMRCGSSIVEDAT